MLHKFLQKIAKKYKGYVNQIGTNNNAVVAVTGSSVGSGINQDGEGNDAKQFLDASTSYRGKAVSGYDGRMSIEIIQITLPWELLVLYLRYSLLIFSFIQQMHCICFLYLFLYRLLFSELFIYGSSSIWIKKGEIILHMELIFTERYSG